MGPSDDDDGGTAIGAPDAPLSVAADAVPVVATVTTLAGSGTGGFADGAGGSAMFKAPIGVGVDADGNVYVADTYNNRIRRVTAAGLVTTVAGSGTGAFADGTGAAASFNLPYGVAVDAAGTLFVADRENQRIRRLTAAGVVTTFAGSGTSGFAEGTGTAASFNAPFAAAADVAGNIYISDSGNHRIRKVTVAGVVMTLAGSGTAAFADGTGAAASFYAPAGISVDAAGTVYIADLVNRRIRSATSAGVVTTLAGGGPTGSVDGKGSAASFTNPVGCAVDAIGTLYVTDNNRVRRLTPAGVVSTLAGSGVAGFEDGVGGAARFNAPNGIAVDSAGNIYVADNQNQRIRKVTAVGIGELRVTWSPPSTPGTSVVTGYGASATATGHATETCTTAGATFCTIRRLTSGVAYAVSVTATSAAGTSSSASTTATPN